VPKKQKHKLPLPRSVYAFTKHRRGDFILFIKEDSEVLEFMQLPDRYQICLTKEEFSEGVKTKLLDFVEQIPKEVFEVAAANIEKFEKKELTAVIIPLD
jgi:hypothetical protein